MRNVEVSIMVRGVPAKVTDEQIAKLVGALIDIGYTDAAETVSDPDLDSADARLVTKLTFDQPTVVILRHELAGEHCPDEECPGVIEDDGECSHCGTDYQDKETDRDIPE